MNTVCIWYGRTHTHMHTITYVFRIVYVRSADNVCTLDNTLSHGQTTPPYPPCGPKMFARSPKNLEPAQYSPVETT
jgi:hypothetical protein